MDNQELSVFLSAIRRLKGIDLSSYRPKFLLRRLNYRMTVTSATNPLAYLNLLKRDNAEFNSFLEALAINISEFFRDSAVFDYFRRNCIKELLTRKKLTHNRSIRIWSAGCAQGQEAYSLAIFLKEALGDKHDFMVKIYGTDINQAVIREAERAEYDLRSLKAVDKILLNKYFTPLKDNLFGLKEEIKAMVKFTKHDVVNGNPYKFMDTIFCRNVMIYLNREEQDKLLLAFYHSLNQGGYLVVGMAETIWGDLDNLYIPVNQRYKIFQKAERKKI